MLSGMLDDDFLEFKSHVNPAQIAAIARILATRIRKVAWDACGEAEKTKPEALADFLTDVMRRSGDSTNGTSESYFDDLVKNWARSRTKALALSTYFYLHTIRAGRHFAQEVDRAIFKGSTFREQTGVPVPGGYEPPDAIQQSQIPPDGWEAINRISNRIENQDASLELLASLARGYDAAYQDRSIDALGTYLHDKVRQWHEYKSRISLVVTFDVQDKQLLDQARQATDQGDFTSAIDLMEEAERRLDESYARDRSERMSLRAEIISLSGDQIHAAKVYDEASQVIAPYDEGLSIRYARLAANVLHDRAFKASDVALEEVADRNFALFQRVVKHAPHGGWQTYAPLLSYLNVISVQAARGLDPSVTEVAETTCRAILSGDRSAIDPEVVAFLKYSLARQIEKNPKSSSGSSRLKEATRLNYEALKVINPLTPFNLWYNVRQGLCSIILTRSEIFGSAPLARKALRAYRNLLIDTPKDRNDFEWARIQHNIGSCLRQIGAIQGDIEALRQALLHCEGALAVRTRDAAPLLFATTMGLRGICFEEIGFISDDLQEIQKAIGSYRESLDILTPGIHGKAWFDYASRLSTCLAASAMLRESFPVFQEALALMRRVDTEWGSFGHGSFDWSQLFLSLLPLARLDAVDPSQTIAAFNQLLNEIVKASDEAEK